MDHNQLHKLEGFSERLSKLEIRTCNIETKLENILKEVQGGVQILLDKLEILEELQLANLQASQGYQQSGNQNYFNNASQPVVQQNLNLSQLCTQLSQLCTLLSTSDIRSTPQKEAQQYPYPAGQQLQTLPTAPQEPQTTYYPSHYSQPSCPVNPDTYMPPQSCTLKKNQSSQAIQQFSPTPLLPQFYGAHSNMYRTLPRRSSFDFTPELTASETYAYNNLVSPSAPSDGSCSLSPYAQMRRHNSMPASSCSSNESQSSTIGSATDGNARLTDDVIDNVVKMGFSRIQVKSTVRKLKKSKQSVELNAVLDRLTKEMKSKSHKGWFRR